MGERYDVEVTADSGAWPIVAAAEGKDGGGAAVLRTTDTAVQAAPPVSARPAELDGHVLSYSDLRPAAGTALAARAPNRSYAVELTGNMDRYRWGLGGDAQHLNVRTGERVRITMRNTTTMYHPMHLHGHTFAVVTANGVRKDTINVLPGKTQVIDFDADNPGQWMYHCHNTYHQAKGMTTTVSYRL